MTTPDASGSPLDATQDSTPPIRVAPYVLARVVHQTDTTVVAQPSFGASSQLGQIFQWRKRCRGLTHIAHRGATLALCGINMTGWEVTSDSGFLPCLVCVRRLATRRGIARWGSWVGNRLCHALAGSSPPRPVCHGEHGPQFFGPLLIEGDGPREATCAACLKNLVDGVLPTAT